MTGTGTQMHAFATELYPLCRSLTGAGTRETLRAIGRRIPLEIRAVPSRTPVLDWSVPNEWNIRDAYIARDGRRLVDFRDSNLHVLNYSTPVRTTLPLGELKPHLFTLPEHPDWIPYRTSYYRENWGFCLTHNQMLALEDGDYEVVIDATLAPGELHYGECVLPGETDQEMLISCHVCHPSLANDNLSGIVVATFLAAQLQNRPRRYTYRFLFAPGTIGAIVWLAANREHVDRIQHGLVLTCVGNAGPLHYKSSRRGGTEIDRAAAHVLTHSGESFELLPFTPTGYDERQYCSPGFNLAVGCLMRGVHGTFPEYHTSADNLDFLKAEALEGTLQVCAGIVEVLEHNRRYENLAPYGEPQLGKRNLYPSEGGRPVGLDTTALQWVLNLSDGSFGLLDIAERSGLPFAGIHQAAEALLGCGLLRQLD